MSSEPIPFVIPRVAQAIREVPQPIRRVPRAIRESIRPIRRVPRTIRVSTRPLRRVPPVASRFLRAIYWPQRKARCLRRRVSPEALRDVAMLVPLDDREESAAPEPGVVVISPAQRLHGRTTLPIPKQAVAPPHAYLDGGSTGRSVEQNAFIHHHDVDRVTPCFNGGGP